MLRDVPVDPDAPEARDWLLDELSKQPYQAAKPNFIDLLARQILDWLSDVLSWLGNTSTAGPTTGVPIWLIAVLIPVAVIVVLAFVVYGLPRLNRRSSVTGALFGDDDQRDAASLRRAADRAAAAGDYSTALAELFRAIARDLGERTVVSTFPGTTAREFARRASIAFPADAEPLKTAAIDFDGVRYLEQLATIDQWDAMVALERRLRTARATTTTDDAPAIRAVAR